MKHNYKTKSQRKAQEGHIEVRKTAKLTKGMKSGKTNQNVKMANKSQEKLKINNFP
jgi:hypothetical protein